MPALAGKKILIVDDDHAFRVGTRALLEDNGYTATTAARGEEARMKLAEERFNLVLSDVVMPGMNGIELLQHIRSLSPEITVLMITGFGSVKTAVEAMRLGAYDYITKPADNSELLLKISRALEVQEKDRELARLREEVHGLYSFGNIVGQNAKMQEVYALVRQVAQTDVAVLVLGETGTGKELVAKAIHYNSNRSAKPFVVINCSALQPTLLESELFGHEKGSFTGADRQHIGKFEEAHGGTVFLDEVGELPLQTQTKLLRVLQEMEIQRVGGNTLIKVDVRVVAATNRVLLDMVSQGTLREDLYYRLNVFPIHLPPLRERLDDLPLIVDHLVKKHASLAGGHVKSLSPALLPPMMSYPWKGNIRELENLIKRAIIKTQGEIITSLDIPYGSSDELPGSSPDVGAADEIPFKDYMRRSKEHAESVYLRRLLERHHGNISTVASAMGLDRKTVYRMIEESGIDLTPYRG